jgi:IS5 family transposase
VLWEALLPVEARLLPEGLKTADRFLSDGRLLEVYRPYFSADRGRKSIPLETFIRLMYLKVDRRFGFERLVAEVTGSITYRVFARIGIDQPVPDPSTLKYIAKRCGPGAIEALNKVLVEIANEFGVVDVSKVRTDSTLVDANIAHPTDSGLLTKAVQKLVTAAGVLTTGLGLDVSVEDATSELKDLNRAIGACARSRQPDRKDQILVLTDQIADLASRAGSQAVGVAEAAAAALAGVVRPPKGARRALNTITSVLAVLDQLVFQATERARERPVPNAVKRLSLRDGDVRCVSKGTTRKGTQFGYTADLSEEANGLIIDYGVHIRQPADSDLVVAAVANISEAIAVPGAVTADQGYGAAHARESLTEAGVGLVAIVAKGNPDPERLAVQDTEEFKILTRWRAGIEARVSTLKRDHGWDRTRMPGITGARTWLGWGIFSHNTRKIATLI